MHESHFLYYSCIAAAAAAATAAAAMILIPFVAAARESVPSDRSLVFQKKSTTTIAG